MSDALSFVEIKEQYVELLPARTVLSLLCGTTGTGTAGTGTTGTGTTGTGTAGTGTAGTGTAGGTGGAGSGGTTITGNTIFVFVAGNQYNTLTGGAAGTGGVAGGGTDGRWYSLSRALTRASAAGDRVIRGFAQRGRGGQNATAPACRVTQYRAPPNYAIGPAAPVDLSPYRRFTPSPSAAEEPAVRVKVSRLVPLRSPDLRGRGPRTPRSQSGPRQNPDSAKVSAISTAQTAPSARTHPSAPLIQPTRGLRESGAQPVGGADKRARGGIRRRLGGSVVVHVGSRPG